jgi:hypothetical protein
MDMEGQIDRLNGEALAMRIIITSLCDRLCELSPEAFAAIRTAFDDAAGAAEQVAIQFGESASPAHTLNAFKIIEGMRAIAVRDVYEPRHGV